MGVDYLDLANAGKGRLDLVTLGVALVDRGLKGPEDLGREKLAQCLEITGLKAMTIISYAARAPC